MKVYASQKFCDSLATRAKVSCAIKLLDVQGGGTSGEPVTITAQLSARSMTATAKAGKRLRVGPAVVVAVPANDAGKQELQEVAESVAAMRDGDVCDRMPKEKGSLYACLHRIYSDFPDHCSFEPDEFHCTVSQEPVLNDFAEQCENLGSGSKCSNRSGKLRMMVDPCGNLRIGFDWSGIYTDKTTEHVSGASGISRNLGKKSEGGIELPGPEFLGSTNPTPGYTGDPRAPLIKITPVRDAATLELKGTVDQPKSVLHILPRLAVGQVCISSMDCERAFKDPETTCEAESRSRSEKKCEASLGIADTGDHNTEVNAVPLDRDMNVQRCCMPIKPRDFVCEGGEFEGMPCTRPRHCGKDGWCTGTPSCQTSGAVWEKGKSPNTEWPCEKADACRDVPQHPQCGYLLFDGKKKKKDDSGEFTVKSKYGFQENERGVCKSTGSTPCDSSRDCSDNCIGYRLFAQ